MHHHSSKLAPSDGGPAGRSARRASRGQATVELSLVLGVLLLAFFAIVDFGRMIAIQAATVTASREAARYGAAVGVTSGYDQYVHCSGIRDAARRVVGGLVAIPDGSIAISYDRYNSGTGTFDAVRVSGTPVSCAANGSVPATTIQSFDRIVVQVTVTYQPITPFLQPIVDPITVVSIDRRTIVKQQ